MSGPDMPPDTSFMAEQMRQDAARAEQVRQDAKDAERKTELAGLRSSAGESARGSASRYFADQGLDPAEYSGTINDRISQILGTISPDDPTPGAYFNDVGKDIYQDETTNFRNKLDREVSKLFPTNFETGRITDTMDDPYLASIEGEQRGSAEQIIQNMLNRGVITTTGKNSADAELDKQAFGVRSRLNELGASTLDSGRQKLTDIAGRARTGADTADLGQSFDASSYTHDVDKAFDDFVSNLGGNIRGKLPGDLFNTSNLAAIAGAGQGAQNTVFDPSALAGIISLNQQPKPPTDPNVTKESVF